MPDAPKRPCCVCRRWFRPDPRVGLRQRACGQLDCQAARRVQTQKSWRDRNADYFIARRIQERGKQNQPPEPLRLPPPLSRLPWDTHAAHWQKAIEAFSHAIAVNSEYAKAY